MTGSVRRRAAPLLIGYARNLSTTTSSQAAPAPALTEKPVGFLAKLFGSQRLDVPLTDELPDYQRPVPVGPPSSPSETQSTTLPNGLKVLSEASYVSTLCPASVSDSIQTERSTLESQIASVA